MNTKKKEERKERRGAFIKHMVKKQKQAKTNNAPNHQVTEVIIDFGWMDG